MVSYDTPGQREYMHSRHEISMMEEFAVHSAIFSAAPLHFVPPRRTRDAPRCPPIGMFIDKPTPGGTNFEIQDGLTVWICCVN